MYQANTTKLKHNYKLKKVIAHFFYLAILEITFFS